MALSRVVSSSADCVSNGPIQVMANITQSRICGVRSQNVTIPAECCNGSEVHTFGCAYFCGTNDYIDEFAKCVRQKDLSSSIGNAQFFCQAGIRGNNRQESKTSSAKPRYHTPQPTWLLFVLIFVLSLSGTTSATIVPSLSGDDWHSVKRAESSCDVQIANNFTTLRSNTLGVGGKFDCQQGGCAMGIGLDSGLNQNNRTINGTSAADAIFDSFFKALSNKTGRYFPALSSLQMRYDFLLDQGLWQIDFTPMLVSHPNSCDNADIESLQAKLTRSSSGARMVQSKVALALTANRTNLLFSKRVVQSLPR